MKEFSLPFKADLETENRGAPTKDAKLDLGVDIIKHLLKLDDIGVFEMI